MNTFGINLRQLETEMVRAVIFELSISFIILTLLFWATYWVIKSGVRDGIKEATPWQTANNSAHTLRVVTSRLKSTVDFSAHHASRKSCTSICCMSAATHYQTFIPPLFSAIWRMICTSFNSSSSSKTNSINSCSGPFLHLAAGGLRTSVTRGLPQ